MNSVFEEDPSEIIAPPAEAGQISDDAKKLKFSIRTITPKQARELLLTVRDRGADQVTKELLSSARDLDEYKSAARNQDTLQVTGANSAAIAKYAQMMREGGWIVNGQPIILDEDGNLLDGVQRLMAAIKADVPFRTFTAENVRADTLHTIDQHRRRSYQGVLEARSYRNAGAVLRAMTKLIRIENGTLGLDNTPISWSRLDKVLDANPLLAEAVDIASSISGSYIRSTARPILCFMALQAGHRDKLKSFMSGMARGGVAAMDSPAGMLGLQFSILEQNDAKTDVDQSLALSILAFNDHLQGKSVRTHYIWKPDYGEAGAPVEGQIGNRKVLLEKAPRNLGLPQMIGYPGLNEARYDVKAETDELTGSPLYERIQEAVSQDDGLESAWMMRVTPELAQKWLEYNTGNRKVTTNQINMIRRDIENGNWMFNAQPICFAGNPLRPDAGEPPRLLNGQHRLRAIIAADTAVELPVAVGIDPEAFATFDVHAKRGVKVAATRVDPRIVSAAARLQWKEDQGLSLTNRSTSPSASEILETIEAHPGLLNAMPRSRHKNMRDIAQAAPLTYFIYRVTREHPQWGADFLDGIEHGEGLERRNPILKLRAQATRQRGTARRGDTLAFLLDHWEKYKSWRAGQDSDDSEDAEPQLRLAT